MCEKRVLDTTMISDVRGSFCSQKFNQLVDTLVGIDSSPFIPRAITVELVHDLERPNVNVKSRALIGIAHSDPTAKDAARSRVQKMAADPGETAHVRQLAAETIMGKITENPNPPQ